MVQRVAGLEGQLHRHGGGPADGAVRRELPPVVIRLGVEGVYRVFFAQRSARAASAAGAGPAHAENAFTSTVELTRWTDACWSRPDLVIFR